MTIHLRQMKEESNRVRRTANIDEKIESGTNILTFCANLCQFVPKSIFESLEIILTHQKEHLLLKRAALKNEKHDRGIEIRERVISSFFKGRV